MKLANVNVEIRINNADKIGKFMKNLDPDFVTLQEVVRHLDSSVFEKYKSKYIIEKQLGKTYPFSFFSPVWVSNCVIKNDKNKPKPTTLQSGN